MLQRQNIPIDDIMVKAPYDSNAGQRAGGKIHT